MKTLLERLLDYYHITYEQYLELTAPVSQDNFEIGHKFDNMDETVAFVKSFVEQNKKIIVYGDYDADGIMATSIVVKMFKYIGYHVDYYIPNRYLDGYGLNVKKSQEIIDKKYDLVITVDNGISAFEAIDLLKENGISVVVFDHHELQEKLPNCDYYLHPILSHFGEISSSGAFVSFMFSKAFLGRFDNYLATLGGISLISDMMPLQEYNRKLLRVVIDNYKDGEFLPIDLLKENEEFSGTTIGMKIAPKINSVGRIVEDESVNDIIQFFVSEDREVVLHYIDWINQLNDERKDISKNSLSEGYEINEDDPAFVIISNEKEGLIGLIANYLVTKYKKPAIVFAKSTISGQFKGSCRVPEGYNVIQIFTELSDYLVTFGGHAFAGGCSIQEEKFDEFKQKFTDYVVSHPAEKEEKECIPLFIRELTFENLKIVNSFSPFGVSMKAPNFVLPRIKTSALMFSRNLEHIMTQVGTNTKLTGFNLSKNYVSQFTYVDLIGTMRKNEYRGFVNLEFLINEIRESEK